MASLFLLGLLIFEKKSNTKGKLSTKPVVSLLFVMTAVVQHPLSPVYGDIHSGQPLRPALIQKALNTNKVITWAIERETFDVFRFRHSLVPLSSFSTDSFYRPRNPAVMLHREPFVWLSRDDPRLHTTIVCQMLSWRTKNGPRFINI